MPPGLRYRLTLRGETLYFPTAPLRSEYLRGFLDAWVALKGRALPSLESPEWDEEFGVSFGVVLDDEGGNESDEDEGMPF
jgi:hypothetical protein